MDRRSFFKAGAAASVAMTAPQHLAAAEAWAARQTSRPHRTADGVLRLMANENPLGPAESARQAAMAAMDMANRYPFGEVTALEEALAAKLGVGTENLFLGAGSTETIQVAVQALHGPGARIVLADPTFEDIAGYQTPLGFEMVRVPLDFRFAHDIARMREIVSRSWRPTIVYICNPNNPTGTITPSSEIDAWIQDAPDTVFFLVDEAYFELVESPDYWSALKWIGDRPNVLVSRTFSKIYGMAGMRLGYGIAHPDTVVRMKAFVQQMNTNIPALAAGVASLADDDHIIRSRVVNSAARQVVYDTLDELGLGYLESHTNFVMHRINGQLSDYIARFGEREIRVGRPFPPMTEYNRLSLGMPEDMERWAEVLREFRARGWV